MTKEEVRELVNQILESRTEEEQKLYNEVNDLGQQLQDQHKLLEASLSRMELEKATLLEEFYGRNAAEILKQKELLENAAELNKKWKILQKQADRTKNRRVNRELVNLMRKVGTELWWEAVKRQ